MVHLIPESKAFCARIKMCDSVIIPPNTEMVIEGRIEGNFCQNTAIIEPKKVVHKKGLLMAKSLVNTSKKEILFSVLNLTTKITHLIRVGKSRLLSLSIYNFRAADEMPLCFAFGCNHMTGAKRTCSLFRFPTNPKERNKWIQRCR